MFDLLILGASAAGVSAAVYGARRKLNMKLISVDIGGEVATSGVVENYPGHVLINGDELAGIFRKQLEAQGAAIDEGFMVTSLTKINKGFKVIAKNLSDVEQIYESKAVIIATGVKPRKLDVPGEEEFYHRGVTYCTICDGPLYKNKDVVILGSGNSALESALMMVEIAKSVTVLIRGDKFKGETVLIDKVQNNARITVVFNVVSQKISGEQCVTSIEYRNKLTSEVKTLPVQGVFVNVGYIPNSDFTDAVPKNAEGQFVVDRLGYTGVPGLYAAGDVTDIPYKQISIATGMGTLSALAAIDYLNRLSV
ncbi:MAG: Thioredoxin reductase [Candidatus Magasanikbacteria bacterium GW2011_GWC2_45_8]|uniref:Thioredoxin reductase n=1 Tax=Candidatus Magasanikbacteria bacterium GW2011_GWC2_45_8 TaxID=1619050 RepID=A0A0G1N138_9BACT|nr:MAG: Thioredoxin reductase [Candidatus Magasanikbacteria bacterium GW2011_GWC2_45_8]HBW73854.1 thioredoxin-disulfide reductase [Candidatus Magasanikbacteria bacterium]